MRKTAVLVIGLVIGLAGIASADTLAVTPTAAMGGTTYGLEITHTNSDPSYVQDNTPAAETIYRFTFLYNLASHSGSTANYRQLLFRAIGPNPFPGAPSGLCPSDPAATIATMQVWLYMKGGTGNNPFIQGYVKGNQCGDNSNQSTAFTVATPKRICGEWWTGSGGTGGLGIALVDPAAACPAHGNAAYKVINLTNNSTRIDTVRLGVPAINSFGANESDVYHFDEFASFRTLAP
jgi:hypothetical protein